MMKQGKENYKTAFEYLEKQVTILPNHTRSLY